MDFDSLSSLPPDVLQNVLELPALAPPPGVVSQFENPPNRNDLAYATIGATVALSSTFFFIRVLRVVCVRKVRVEDFFVLAAYVLATSHTWVLLTIIKHPGYFVHQWNVRVKDLWPHIYAFHMGINIYVASILAIKTGIILEWFRIFNPMRERNWFFWMGTAILVLNTLFYSSAVIVENTSCRPIQRLWNRTVPGTCIDLSKEFYLTSGAFNLFSDVFILILPQKIVWKLNMSTKQKIGLSLLFAVGVLTCLTAALHIYFSENYVQQADKVYAAAPESLLTQIELHALLLVSCIPAIPSVLAQTKARSKIRSAFEHLGLRTKDEKPVVLPMDPSHRTITGMGLRQPSGPYRMLDEQNLPLGYQNSRTTSIEGRKKPPSSVGEQEIIRTTEVVITDHYIAENARDLQFYHQHP